MNLIVRIADHLKALYSLRASIRNTNKKNKNRFETIEAQLRNLVAGDAGPNDAGLWAHQQIIPMIMVGTGTGGGDNYVRARRLELDPVYSGHKGWIKDPDDDIAEYAVLPTPGMLGFFAGCRFLAVLSHLSNFTADQAVYVPIAGECFGFAAKTTGAPTAGSGTAQNYPWTQLWTHSADNYSSGDVIEGYTYPKALLLSSLTRDSGLVDRNEVPTNTPIFVWHAPSIGGSDGGFVFEIGTDPVYDECEGAAV